MVPDRVRSTFWASPRHGRTSLETLMSATTGVEPVVVDGRARQRARRWSGAQCAGAVKRKTAADRFSRALSRIALWCRKHRHLKVREQWLSRRSQTAYIAWDRFVLLERRYPLPPARLAHPLRLT